LVRDDSSGQRELWLHIRIGRIRSESQAAAGRGVGGVSHIHVARAGLERGLRVTNVAWAKNSCYGRELGTEGIDSYTVSQSISAAAAVN
jgi:hypothetical protein